ncbi:MAG: ferrous iron transport protein B [Tannerella sp.]|jgi:ferrous iron transport protein B|nr:ferrous iron transport protein B [Tannerella sp.]
MKLSNLHNGESAIIVKVYGHGGFRKRITEMGFVRGRKVKSILNSPLNDPVKYSIMGYEVSLRHSEADMIEVLYESDADDLIEATYANDQHIYEAYHSIHEEHPVRRTPAQENVYAGGEPSGFGAQPEETPDEREETPAKREAVGKQRYKPDKRLAYRKNVINIALVGNPNSGKTSLFNALSGRSEHVGNYSGVTVDAKTGHFNYKGYHFNITDLPGTYSLSAYSPEERFVRRHIFEKMPDVIINTVVASNIERNLYLTTELIDLNPRMVVALNMYDELQASGAELDYKKLGGMIGVPMIPTVAKMKKGLDALLDTVIDIFENRSKVARHIHIHYGTTPEPEITALSNLIRRSNDAPQQFPARYWAIKLLENDKEAEIPLSRCADYNRWKEFAGKASERIEHRTNEDTETVISDAKYGFIAGALKETYTEGTIDSNRKTRYIDNLVTDKWLGFPIFIFLMWIMFMATFYLGSYPQDWIELGVGKLGDFISANMPEGPLKDLLIGGVIGGVGSVIVFLPNILILYLFISFMEDSGYMARAAFIMDRIMHKMDLHGKSFIPLIMGFGCNVPAIMATRTIESHSSRLITILINPFMSCSARIPVFVLLAGAFFPDKAGTVLVFMYLLGIIVAVLTAKLFRKTFYKKEETPFVMELPPYRMPTLNATVKHMWDKGEQYLKKMGGVILVASIIIWFLGYYPQNFPQNSSQNEENAVAQTFEDSYLGKIGKFCEPVMKPLGFDWKATVALLAGTTAKEIVVSTLGVLYKNEDEAVLSKTLTASGDFTQRSALAFMVFILLYFPCIAALAAIRNEAGRKWALFSALYGTTIAWVAGFTVYTITGFF